MSSQDLQHSPELNNDTTPPRTTPSPDAADPELKLSRKREREVSVEPVTTPTASNDTELFLSGRKDSFTPLKKNRRRLDPTVEEDDNGSGSGGSGSTSPPILASPRQEMRIKVRQISQGVEDISWKNMQYATYDNDEDVEIDGVPPQPVLTSQKDKVDCHAVMDGDDSFPRTPDISLLSQSIQNVQDNATMISTPHTPTRPRAGSESGEKGLKRKFLEHGTGQGPTDEQLNHVPEPLKRPRDESDKDDNPRETKRPSPPPPSPPKVHKPSGFMAYASTSSPFASVKGQNVFMSGKTPSPSPFSGCSASTLAPPDPNAINATASQSSIKAPTATKRPGFAAFASTSSPFAAVARAKSPTLGSSLILGRAKSPSRRTKPALVSNPFASYAGPVHSFAIPASKRPRAGSPDGSSRSSLERNSTVSAFGDSADGSDSGPEDDGDNQSFGERLRAAKDYDDEMLDGEPKVQLSEQDVTTGEEDEDTIYSVRGKLFSLDDNSWKEKGTGLLKLNVKREDGTGARLVMRKDAVYTVILNVTLFGGMRCSLAQDPRYLRVSAIENGVTTTYNIKVSNAGIARDLMEEINSNIPL